MKTRLLKIKKAYRYLPTCLTLGNTLCGFTAILNTLLVYKIPAEEVPALLVRSAWLIVGAMIFDMLDGWTARKLHATSVHGLQMDSLADFGTFGLAPAVMVAVMAHAHERFEWLTYPWVWLLCGAYVSCVALRLALYNVIAMQDGHSDEFHGLPSPGGAAAVASVIFLYNSNPDSPLFSQLVQVLPFYVGFLGLLMVSPIPYMHVGKWLGSKRFYKLKILFVIGFGLLFSWRASLVTAITINLYVFGSPLKSLLSRLIFGARRPREA